MDDTRTPRPRVRRLRAVGVGAVSAATAASIALAVGLQAPRDAGPDAVPHPAVEQRRS